MSKGMPAQRTRNRLVPHDATEGALARPRVRGIEDRLVSSLMSIRREAGLPLPVAAVGTSERRRNRGTRDARGVRRERKEEDSATRSKDECTNHLKK